MTGSPVVGAIVGLIVGLLVASAIGAEPEGAEPSPHLKEIDAEGDFEQILEGSDVVLLEFHSRLCPPCKKLRPILSELATEYAGRAVVATANARQVAGLSSRHDIKTVPTVKLFKTGQVRETIVGPKRKEVYEKALNQLLAADAG